ncbi:MAG: MFS transporter [Armatimonadota bacterium]|nr:MFS transporter [Armatimonadota bacterium]
MAPVLPTLVGAGVVLAIIRERPARGEEAFEGLSLVGLGRDLKLLVVLSAIFALGAFSYSFLIVHAEALGYQREFIPALYLLFTVAASALSYHFGLLADRWGRRPVLAIAYGLWALVCLSCIYLRSEALLPLVFLLFGSHKAALEPTQKAIVAEFAPEGLRGSILGGFNMVVGLCALPASLVAGVLWDRVSATAPIWLGLALTVAAMGLLSLLREPEGD